jgi:serine/threonine protein kinase/tetratricopeptide (TPR) repeat protein
MNAPEPADGSLPPTSQVVRILTEYLEDLEAGASVDADELAAQCPELAEPLKGCLASLKFLQEAASEHDNGRRPNNVEPPAGHDHLADLGRFGDFRLVREVGRGGMGIVYEAEQVSLGRRVALKVLPFAATLNARQLQRFRNEAQAAACLHHTNIVPVFGIGCEHGVHYYSMQYIDGQTLAAVIAELGQDRGSKIEDGGSTTTDRGLKIEDRGSGQEKSASTLDDCEHATRSSILGPRSSVLDPRSSFFKMAACLGIQAAEALDHAHQLGVVHRDIKPGNLLLEIVPGVETLRVGPAAFPTGIRLWVTDFGLARLATSGGDDGANLTLTGDLVGTIRYMSPEQAQGRPLGMDHRTDIYSLGVTLYELLTLAAAFPSGDRHELLTQIAFEEPTRPRRLNPAIPTELETIVLKAMAKSPSERYSTARELAADLERFLKDEPIRARRPSPVQRARKWARRHRAVVWSALVALLVSLAGVMGSVGWVMRDRASRYAKLVDAVEDARQFQDAGKWPEAQAASIRANDLLLDGVAGASPDLAQRVHDLLIDCRFVGRLEEIRLLQAADVHAKENRFAQERAIPEYQQAFKEYGLDPSATPPAKAAEILNDRSPAVQAILLVALEDWLELARKDKGVEVKWLEEVLGLADSDPWRKRVRSARKRRERPTLEKLAEDVQVSTQPPQALILLQRALLALGDQEQSVALLKRAHETFPGDFWINHELGIALQTGPRIRYEEAVRFLTAAQALRPKSPGVRVNLGLALYKNGRLGDAIVTLRQAIDLKPDYVAAYNSLGEVYLEAGQLENATTVFRQALNVMPEDLEAQWNIGVIQAGLGQNEEALAAWDHILSSKPNFIESHFEPAAQQSLKTWHAMALAALRQQPAKAPQGGAAAADKAAPKAQQERR